MTRVFIAAPLAAGPGFRLPPAAAHHVGRVLRLRPGDPLVLFDGGGGEFPARIVDCTGDGVFVEIGPRTACEREAPLALTLAQALQAADKMDLTIQKAVELGATRIVPLAAERSVLKLAGERAERRQAHWRQVIVAACEQCGRNRLPRLEPVQPLAQWLATPSTADLRLLLSPSAGSGLAAVPAAAEIELLCGPEGGFSGHEAAAARAAGFRGLRLGPRILRSETAGLAALAAIQARFGDFA
jgi:16S rRNA (uracil1498-N3)-methyltransferase